MASKSGRKTARKQGWVGVVCGGKDRPSGFTDGWRWNGQLGLIGRATVLTGSGSSGSEQRVGAAKVLGVWPWAVSCRPVVKPDRGRRS